MRQSNKEELLVLGHFMVTVLPSCSKALAGPLTVLFPPPCPSAEVGGGVKRELPYRQSARAAAAGRGLINLAEIRAPPSEEVQEEEQVQHLNSWISLELFISISSSASLMAANGVGGVPHGGNRQTLIQIPAGSEINPI
ncbi:hypothetical protein FQA47_024319 [Oryzias melastigma]|uniref:Uncharacterized protein n=1 Tax=Oryzias melastigma TaxID=30732 RepID=A0A834BXS4_ORYME|nr:hypothetical protein FQA47_024319 [Oryzias melastigma]